jgi:S1-C subfamily serine protease
MSPIAPKCHGFSAAIACVATLAAPALGAAAFSARDVYREAAPSVVMVYARTAANQSHTGTGTVVGASGLVLTNDHVVSAESGRASRDVSVFFKPERVTGDMVVDLRSGYRAKVVARSAKLDLALLELSAGLPGDVQPLPFADSEAVEIGDPVAAIGHPGGGGLWTLTTGTISSVRKRNGLDLFQTDTAINPGNSGGPLLDAGGRLIGVATFVVRVSDDGLPLEGLNYSLRANQVRRWLARQGVEVPVAGPRVAASGVQTPAADPPQELPDVASGPLPRPFEGPAGESMFGFPNPRFDHETLRSELYQHTLRNADSAFEQLEEMDPTLDEP